MSELTVWQQIQRVKTALVAIIGALAGAVVLGTMILDWRISVKLSEMDLGTDEKIVAMDTVAAENTRTGTQNTKDIDINRRNVEAAFRRLMGMPPVDDDT